MIINALRTFTEVNYFLLKFINNFYVFAVTFSQYCPKIMYDYFLFLQNNFFFPKINSFVDYLYKLSLFLYYDSCMYNSHFLMFEIHNYM
jgi:hypothetical protein